MQTLTFELQMAWRPRRPAARRACVSCRANARAYGSVRASIRATVKEEGLSAGREADKG